MVSSLPSNTDSLFWGDIADVTYTQVQATLTLSIAVLLGSTTLLSINEKYEPDASGRVNITELRDIIKPFIEEYLPTEIPSIGNKTFPNLHLKIDATSAGSTISHNVKVVPSMGRVGETPTSFKRNYTLQHSKVTHWSRYEVVALNAKLTHTVGFAYLSGTTPKYLTKTISASSSDYYELNVSATRMLAWFGIAASVNPDAAIYTLIESSDGSSVTDRIQINYTGELRGDEITLLHQNYFGLPETFTLHGASTERLVSEASFAYASRRYLRYDSRQRMEHTANTGYLDRQRYNALLDLSMSPQVFAVAQLAKEVTEPSAKVEVTVTGIDSERRRSHGGIHNATLTFRLTDEYQRTELLPEFQAIRIFDPSFNRTFE